jgi:hypothetical protein
MNQPNKLECYMTLGGKVLSMKIALAYAYCLCTKKLGRKKCCEYEAGFVFTTLHFLRNLRIGQIS